SCLSLGTDACDLLGPNATRPASKGRDAASGAAGAELISLNFVHAGCSLPIERNVPSHRDPRYCGVLMLCGPRASPAIRGVVAVTSRDRVGTLQCAWRCICLCTVILAEELSM